MFCTDQHSTICAIPEYIWNVQSYKCFMYVDLNDLTLVGIEATADLYWHVVLARGADICAIDIRKGDLQPLASLLLCSYLWLAK